MNLDDKWGVDEFEFAKDRSEEDEYQRTFDKVYGEGKEKGKKEIEICLGLGEGVVVRDRIEDEDIGDSD